MSTKRYTILLLFIMYQCMIPACCQTDTSCFRKYIRVEFSDDIKNIHCYEDGYDLVQITFECNKSTLGSIVTRLNLIRDDSYPYREDNYHEFDWWQHSQVRKLKCFYKTEIHTDHIQDGPWVFVGYDEENSLLYYGRFDL